MGFDYNYFTKKELSEFLNKYGDNFKYITKPYLIILEEKIEKKHKEIEELLAENDVLIGKLRNALGEERIRLSIKLQESHGKFQKLNQELDKLSKKAYSR